MAYVIEEGRIGMQPIADTSTTQTHPLGTIVRAKDPSFGQGEFIYLEGAASTAIGSWVTYDSDAGGTTLLVANAKGMVAIAMSANVDAQYGWYQISGIANGIGSTVSIADNADLYATATGGTIGSTVVTGDRVWNAESRETSSDGTVKVDIGRPFVTDAVNSGTS
jgi:hypothetical protein